MVICVGFYPKRGGDLQVFDGETNDLKLLTFNESDPKNVETISALFEFIGNNVTKKSIDYFCVYMDDYFQNEFRQRFIETAKKNSVKNVRIIGYQQAHLCEAIEELSISPKTKDEIWIFSIFYAEICCTIWKFDENNEWKFQNYIRHERTEEEKDKSPKIKDFQKLKNKMKIGKEIPYIYVNHYGCVVNENVFKAVFPQFQKIIFQQKFGSFAKYALNYARFMSGEKSFFKYKSESLLECPIEIIKSGDTEIIYVNFDQVLPFSKTTIIDVKNNENLIVLRYDIDTFPSIIPIKEEGKCQINFNIDIDGVFIINLKKFHPSLEDSNSFAIPTKLDNYDPDLNAIGIDLGTTECCAAVIRRNGPDFVVLDIIRNSRTMPSFIAFDETEAKFGQIVIDRMRFKAEYSVYDTKRILGKKIDQIIVDPLWPFKISYSSEDDTLFIEVETLNGKVPKSCKEITADLIAHIKTILETYQGKKLTEAVITVPSEFSYNQKEATLKAAEMAGFTKIHFLPEPIAAAFAYFTEIKIPENSNILICDCGGGTVDICLAKINTQMLQIKNFYGDSHIGGRDFDTVLFDHFSGILNHKFGIDVMKTSKKFVLKQKCQNIKHTLSAQIEDMLDVSDYDYDSNELIKISRKEFEEMSANLLLKIKNVVCRSVSNAKLERSEIDYVFQVGGGCRMPMIKEMLKEIFPNSNHRCHLYPDWVVAHGAALYAYHLKTKEVEKPIPKTFFEKLFGR